MIKLCIFSDSHGVAKPMMTAIERENPDLCFFLGDGERDFKTVQEYFPSLPFYAVRGNCDLRSTLSSTLVCTVGGVCIFATHGHLFHVKYEPELDSLAMASQEAGASIALFGHTHHACIEKRHGITLINPGASGRSVRSGYAILSLDGGRFQAELKIV